MSGFAKLVYTPGKLGSAQPIPQETIPTWVLLFKTRGPPLSSVQESFPVVPAHIILSVISATPEYKAWHVSASTNGIETP